MIAAVDNTIKPAGVTSGPLPARAAPDKPNIHNKCMRMQSTCEAVTDCVTTVAGQTVEGLLIEARVQWPKRVGLGSGSLVIL